MQHEDQEIQTSEGVLGMSVQDVHPAHAFVMI